MEYRQVKVPLPVAKRLKVAAAQQGMKMGEALEEAIALFEEAHQSFEDQDPRKARAK